MVPHTLLALFVALGLAQSGVFISGTVTADDGTPIPKAMIGAGERSAETDKDGHFAVRTVPGSVKLRVAAPGFEPMVQDLLVKAGEPLFGLTITLKRDSSDVATASVAAPGAMTEGELRALTDAAIKEWSGFNDNILKTLDYKVTERWGDLVEEPIPLWVTKEITIALITPYQLYRTSLSEALRKMEPTDRLPFMQAVAISVTPKQMDAPDIIKVVVQRDGATIEPLSNGLQPKEFKSRLGATTVLHAGVVMYPLAAFAPPGSVRIVAIPEHGSNFQGSLDSETLAKLK